MSPGVFNPPIERNYIKKSIDIFGMGSALSPSFLSHETKKVFARASINMMKLGNTWEIRLVLLV